VPTNAVRVLLVEDNPGDARLVTEMLRETGDVAFALVHVTTVAAAVEALTNPSSEQDVVLLDLSLPDETGLDTVRSVADVADRTSIVVMTGANDEELGIAATKAGAQDYLVKGQVDGRGLRRTLRLALERNQMRQRLHDRSTTDELTGLYNRRGFLEFGGAQLRLASRHGTTALLFFMDLDGLKVINDTYGHAEGNRAIMEASRVLENTFRRTDVLARLSGDEFAGLVLDASATDWPDVRKRMNDTRDRFNAQPDRSYRLDFSVGMLVCPPSDTASLEDLLQQADAAMYEEKRGKKAAPLATNTVREPHPQVPPVAKT